MLYLPTFLQVFEEFFVADEWFVYSLFECSQVFLVLLQRLPYGVVYEIRN